MCSIATGWKDGRRCWSARHDADRGIENLATEGDLPPVFSSIRDQLLSKQRERGGCDYVFDIPVATAESLTGYRYDQHIPALGNEPFEVLAAPAAPASFSEQKPSFWKRLFGV